MCVYEEREDGGGGWGGVRVGGYLQILFPECHAGIVSKQS